MVAGSSTLGAQTGNIQHNVMAEQLVNKLQQASKDNPGSDFIVVQRLRQGEEPRIWTTGDPTQAKQLFKNAYDVFDKAREPATT